MGSGNARAKEDEKGSQRSGSVSKKAGELVIERSKSNPVFDGLKFGICQRRTERWHFVFANDFDQLVAVAAFASARGYVGPNSRVGLKTAMTAGAIGNQDLIANGRESRYEPRRRG